MKVSFQIPARAWSLDTIQPERNNCRRPVKRWRSASWAKHTDFNLQGRGARSRHELMTAGGPESQSWPVNWLTGIVTKINKLCKGNRLCHSSVFLPDFQETWSVVLQAGGSEREAQKCSLCYSLPAVKWQGVKWAPISHIFKRTDSPFLLHQRLFILKLKFRSKMQHQEKWKA